MTAVCAAPSRAAVGRVPEELHGRFDGYVDLVLPNPTPEGRTRFRLTSGRIDADAESYFGRGYCHWLAGAVHTMTGWDLVTYDRQMPDGTWTPAHTAVVAPTGRIVDIFGEHAPEDVIRRYETDPQGRQYQVRTRRVRNEDMCGEVITGVDHLRGDPMWWAKSRFGEQTLRAVLVHFARALVEQTGHGQHLRYPEMPHPNDRITAPALVKAEETKPATGTNTPTHHAVTSSGGSAMSTLAEQARTTLSISNEKATYVRGALCQAELDLSEILVLLAQVTADAEPIQQAAAIYTQAKENLDQVQGLISAATQAAEQYAVHL